MKKKKKQRDKFERQQNHAQGQFPVKSCTKTNNTSKKKKHTNHKQKK